jgi:lysophospholipase L1-like esterase
MKQILTLSIAAFLLFSFKSDKPRATLYIIGDSTVKNGRGDGAGGLRGWGEKLVFYFDSTKINVENHALGGTSSRTFQTRGLWDTVLKKIKKGDYVMMQFGHNDGGAINDSTRARGTIKGIGEDSVEIDNILTKKHEVVHSYGWYMRKMVRETKAKGAIPIIVTPIPRNDWKDGKIIRSTGSYPDWAKEIAIQEKIQYIDMYNVLSEKLDTYGENQVTDKYFFKRDHTHPTEEGAKLIASLMANEIKALKSCKFKRNLLKNLTIK